MFFWLQLFGFFSYLSLIAKSSAAAREGGEVQSTFQGFASRAVLLLAFLMHMFVDPS